MEQSAEISAIIPMIEKAIYITKIEQATAVTEEYSRLYFGNEFCQRLLPSIQELGCAISFAKERKMDFTLVTPFVTDQGIRVVEALIAHLIGQCDKRCEVVFNDWGVFRILTSDSFKGKTLPVLGRLLTKQKRDPRISSLGSVPEPSKEYFRSFSSDSRAFSDFLGSHKIERIELDNVLQGISRNEKRKASLYYPFGYITTTRMCFFSDSESGPRYVRKIAECRKECREYEVSLSNKQMKNDILLKGNTQFFKNIILPNDMESLHIDRTIYEPFLPI